MSTEYIFYVIMVVMFVTVTFFAIVAIGALALAAFEDIMEERQLKKYTRRKGRDK